MGTYAQNIGQDQGKSPAFSNAQRLRFARVKGNSQGSASLASKTVTGTVSKAAQARLSRAPKDPPGAKTSTGQPLKTEKPTFGPLR